MILNVAKVLIPSIITFAVGIGITPLLTGYFYKYKMWKKNPRTESGDITSEHFKKLHNTAGELSTPRVGGVIIWVSVLLSVLIFYILSMIFPDSMTLAKFNFLSRNQTVVPLAALVLAALIGLADDFIQIFGTGIFAKDGLTYRQVKVWSVVLVGILVSLWFYIKLGTTVIHIPFDGDWDLGIFFIPFFIFTLLATFSTSVIDGMDGLSGGIMGEIFGAYAIIAFFHNQIDLAAFCAVVAGAILAFLWFNIPPARFYMGETGMVALTVALCVVAFLTNTILFLPIIALPLVVTSLSVIVQVCGYKYCGKRRMFKVAPLHHHFEAIGWSREKVVMRYWVLGLVCAILGTILAIIG